MHHSTEARDNGIQAILLFLPVSDTHRKVNLAIYSFSKTSNSDKNNFYWLLYRGGKNIYLYNIQIFSALYILFEEEKKALNSYLSIL